MGGIYTDFEKDAIQHFINKMTDIHGEDVKVYETKSNGHIFISVYLYDYDNDTYELSSKHDTDVIDQYKIYLRDNKIDTILEDETKG